MAALKPEQIEKWLAAGERLIKSPIAGVVLHVIGDLLPKAGITPEQLAGMKARLAEAGARKARAQKRAGQ